MIEKIETPKSGGIGRVLHEKMDSDVDFPEVVFPNRENVQENLLLFYRIDLMSRNIVFLM